MDVQKTDEGDGNWSWKEEREEYRVVIARKVIWLVLVVDSARSR